jgi:hypothetical protein
MKNKYLLFFILLSFNVVADISGNINYEGAHFFQDGLYADQKNSNNSIYTNISYFANIKESSSFNLKIFARSDENDENRTHADIRELYMLNSWDNFEIKYGINKIYWGAVEFNNLVDVINQDDFVEGFGSDEKLGQPMVQLTYLYDTGNFDFFILPYFRERQFTSVDGGRPRWTLEVEDNPWYEDEKKEKHIDFALSNTQTLGDFDVRLSYFDGTDREPVLSPIINPITLQPLKLQAMYYQMQQAGLDITAVLSSWLLKFETIFKKTTLDEYNATSAGFEYTIVGLIGRADLGLITEIAQDSRAEKATTLYQNDVMIGTRLTLNDAASTTFLLGAMFDQDDGANVYSLEFERRLFNSFKIKIESVYYKNTEEDKILQQFRKDSFTRFLLSYHF